MPQVSSFPMSNGHSPRGTASWKRRRVAITGLGVVAPGAVGRDAFWANLVEGRSAVVPISAFDSSSYPCRIAAEVREFSAEAFLTPRRARQMWRFSQFATVSALLAVQDANLEVRNGYASRTGVCFGTTTAGMGTADQIHAEFLQNGPTRAISAVAAQCAPHAPTSHVAIELGATGPALTMSSNCCTGLDAVAAAYAQIVAGNCDIVVAGASEAPLYPFTFSTFSTIGLLSTRSNDNPQAASRPFDLLRDGLVLGEGGGAVVLEDWDIAEARGARIYAEVAGYGSTSYATDTRKTDVTGSTLAAAIRIALQNAQLDADEIDYINAHGNSLPDHDVCDTNAFKLAFGKRAYNIPISSLKSTLGQAISASGLFQVASACLTMEYAIAPPTINQSVRDPDCDLDYVPNIARPCRAHAVLLNAHAMGGSVAALILRKPTT
jgi:3-oxoacyl-[acyl-carrier-protein] synthase II